MRIDGIQTYQQFASALDRGQQSEKAGQGEPTKQEQVQEQPRLSQMPESVTFLIARGEDSLEISKAGRMLLEQQIKEHTEDRNDTNPAKAEQPKPGQVAEPDLVHQIDLLV